MKKVIYLLLFVIPMFTAYAGAEEANRIGIGGNLSYYVSQGGDVDGAEVNIEDVLGYGVSLNYLFTRRFSIEISCNYYKMDITDDDKDVLLIHNIGEATIVPLLLKGQYRIETGTKTVPYFGAGIGYLFNSLKISNEMVELPAALAKYYDADTTVSASLDDSVAYLLNAGVEQYLKDNFAVNLDIQHIWSEADADASILIDGLGEYKTNGKIKLDALLISLGVRYYF